MFSPMDDNLNHQIEDLLDSTLNHGYKALPKCIRSDLSEEEWKWHPDKDNILDDYCMPEVSHED